MAATPDYILKFKCSTEMEERVNSVLTSCIVPRYRLVNVYESDAVTCASLCMYGRPCRFSYMDKELRGFTSLLAIMLRECTGRNQFFDIRQGHFTLFRNFHQAKNPLREFGVLKKKS